MLLTSTSNSLGAWSVNELASYPCKLESYQSMYLCPYARVPNVTLYKTQFLRVSLQIPCRHLLVPVVWHLKLVCLFEVGILRFGRNQRRRNAELMYLECLFSLPSGTNKDAICQFMLITRLQYIVRFLLRKISGYLPRNLPLLERCNSNKENECPTVLLQSHDRCIHE